ncbi:MAG: PilZ domain-containing protein [Candidatus Aureabacteria bacterium]|nr:PilZ domain-containing protein [Candidatus Auribacterota bacterium]
MFKKLKKKKAPERRKYRRVRISEIISVNIYDEKKVIQSLENGGLSKNLSLKGLLFESKMKFSLYGRIRMDLDVSLTPNVKMISIVGEIIRIEEIIKDQRYEYGISFVRVPKKDEQALEKFIEHCTGEGEDEKGFMDKKRSFLFHFFSESGMSYSERERGWFKIPPVRKRKILE